MFGRSSSRGSSPLMGGIAGMVLQNVVMRKVTGGRGGMKGMLVGMAAHWALNRFLGGGARSQRQWQRR